MKKLTLMATVAVFAASWQAQAAAPLCASADQKTAVAENLKTKPAMIANGGTARMLKLPEEVVTSAMPADQAVGVAGTAFAQVWETIPAWGETLFLVIKGGNVFEIHSAAMPGKASERSNFYNLEAGAPLGGHLRPDLLNSIYAVVTPGERGGTTRGVVFYGPGGESMFAAFVGGEGGEAGAEQTAAFDKTLAAMKALPRACS
ncbi:MAG: hypothetical protein KDE14_11855 [Rhodobacteraceae bacterium]|nr:hypothetical protein [Paracoccaceae bacterium]